MGAVGVGRVRGSVGEMFFWPRISRMGADACGWARGGGRGGMWGAGRGEGRRVGWARWAGGCVVVRRIRWDVVGVLMRRSENRRYPEGCLWAGKRADCLGSALWGFLRVSGRWPREARRLCGRMPQPLYAFSALPMRSRAVMTFSRELKALMRTWPSPHLPKPAPGVQTTCALFRRRSKNSQESRPVLIQR